MQRRPSSFLDCLRHWRGFLQVVIFALFAQAFVPAGMALAADLHEDGADLEIVICRVLADLDEDGQPNDDGVDDCPMCLALDFGKGFLSSAPVAAPVASLVLLDTSLIPVSSPLSAVTRSSLQVRAPPFV